MRLIQTMVVDDSNQIALPAVLSVAEITREKTLGGALELCAKAAGFALDKQLQMALKVDRAQFSRWHNGTEGILWDKFIELMDRCGNDAPLLWMVHQRGYDLTAMRKRETEVEKQNRELREENAALRRVLIGQGGK